MQLSILFHIALPQEEELNVCPEGSWVEEM